MIRFLSVSVLLAISVVAFGQTPQARLTYEDKSGTTGHTLIVDGKSFGPYKEISSISYSTSGTAGVFVVTKRDKTYIVAQGKEWGPLTAGFESESIWVADDGKLWATTAVKYGEGDDAVNETQLWVNGKVYGPFEGVNGFEYSEAGGHWIASVQRSEEEYDVIFDGKPQGPFPSVEHTWVFPDGKGWGWSTTDSEGSTTVVTQERTFKNVQSANLDQMYPRSAHWAFGVRLGDEEELILVDGKTYPGYLNFSGLYTTMSGRHWGFTAEKLTDTGDYPVVVINGKEFIGEGLGVNSIGDKEFFTWSVKDGNKVTIQVLSLP